MRKVMSGGWGYDKVGVRNELMVNIGLFRV